ncbi:MAG: universal stress protein [Calothrix sp. C42_A2020_038]|nr:universal stress protein [Calothrix sp. C42_A2020_038]
MFGKIIVAIDNSEISDLVFDKAVSLAKAAAAHLMLLNVISPSDEEYPYPIYIYPNTVVPSLHEETLKEYMGQWEELKQERINFLSKRCQQAIDLGINTEYTQSFGSPGRIICEIASNWNADLIIVGRRGRTGLSELFLGSVSNYVLHHAPCSVLTIQQPIKANTEESQTVHLNCT